MKRKFLIAALFVVTSVLGSWYASYLDHGTKHAEAAPQKVKGYMWSDNIGWISFSCENLGPCGANTYQVTLDSGNGLLMGKAWSNNLGYLEFNVGCPPSAVGTCPATLVGNNLEGWARFTSGAVNNPSWDGWVSFSSTSYVGAAPAVSYGPTLTGNALAGNAWGSTVVGWLNFVDVTIEILNVNTNLQLKPSTTANLTDAQVVALTPSLALPGPGTNFNLYWYSLNPAVVYTSCTATSTGPSTWVGYTPLGPVAVVPPGPANHTTPPDFVTYTTGPSQTYTLTCNIQGGGVDIAEAIVTGGVAVNNLELRARLVGDPALVSPTAPNAPNPLVVPFGTSAVKLYWWKSPSAPIYTGCHFTSSGTNANGPLTWPAFAPPVLPTNDPKSYQYTFSGTSKDYKLTCDIQGGGTDDAEAHVDELAQGPQCNVLSFGWVNPLCPIGSPGYIPPEISWSTSNALSCNDSPNGWQTDPLNNNNISGSDDVSSYPSGTTFDMTCDGVNGGTCSPASPLTLTYLSANDPLCANGPISYQCSDGVDNADPEDALADTLDPGCHTDGNAANPASYNPLDPNERNSKGKIIEN